MSENERVEITKFISKIIGKIFVSPTIGSGSILSQAYEGIKMIDAGASALVVKPQAVKESANFFGSKYDLRSYSPSRHDSFYINYINQIIKIVNIL